MPKKREPERAGEDLSVEGIPEGAVVVEVPGERDVGEARQRSEAVGDDEPERDEEERGVPAQRRKREPTGVAGAAAASAAAALPCRYRWIYAFLNSVQILLLICVPLAVTLFGSR